MNTRALPFCFGKLGKSFEFRFLAPADEKRLISFFESHTQDTVLSRYGYAISQMTHERAQALVGINQDWDSAIGVFERNDTGEYLVAIGRACRIPETNQAELAFVVREDRRRQGLAWLLLECLTAIMRSRNVTSLIAQVRCDNSAMLQMFRKAGAKLATIDGTDDVQVVIVLRSAPLNTSVKRL